MLINGTVGITMVGGLAAFGISGSALLTITPIIAVKPDPSMQAIGQQYISGALNMRLQPRVLHQGEVSINDPNLP
jgi:hypothetical protein